MAESEKSGKNRENSQKSVKESEIDKKLSVHFCLKPKNIVSKWQLELSRIAPLDARAIFRDLPQKGPKIDTKVKKIGTRGENLKKNSTRTPPKTRFSIKMFSIIDPLKPISKPLEQLSFLSFFHFSFFFSKKSKKILRGKFLNF